MIAVPTGLEGSQLEESIDLLNLVGLRYGGIPIEWVIGPENHHHPDRIIGVYQVIEGGEGDRGLQLDIASGTHLAQESIFIAAYHEVSCSVSGGRVRIDGRHIDGRGVYHDDIGLAVIGHIGAAKGEGGLLLTADQKK